jgi:hypothetical protein
VSVIGGDEKRAFTVMVTITSAGFMLPFQAIYMGKSPRSCPKLDSPMHKEAVAAGFKFELSGTQTYWSNQDTMKTFVNDILAPYFNDMKAKLGRPSAQRTLWMIDVWSVHRSREFLDWMYNTHPTILIDFVPGGCTGVAQPCDVGIQRAFKHVTNQCFLEDVVKMALTQIDNGEKINIDDGLPLLRDASVRWIWKAYESLNKPEIVKKVSGSEGNCVGSNDSPCSQAFKLCIVRNFDLSHETLRSFEMQEKLHQLHEANDPFWLELTTPSRQHQSPVTDAVVAEDAQPDVDGDLDDSAVNLNDVLAATHKKPMSKKKARQILPHENGGLLLVADAEQLNTELPELEEGRKEDDVGRGKRRKTMNRLYRLDDFARHWDNDGSDIE